MANCNLSLLYFSHYFVSFNNFAAMIFGEKPTDKLDKEDYYLTEEGYIVFTEAYHLKRGYCCQSNCRHCPYGFNKKNKKEDKQTMENTTASKEKLDISKLKT